MQNNCKSVFLPVRSLFLTHIKQLIHALDALLLIAVGFGGRLQREGKNRHWHIRATSAIKGDGLYEGLDWMTNTLKKKK